MSQKPQPQDPSEELTFQQIVEEAKANKSSESFSFSVPDNLFDNLEEEQNPSQKQ